MYQALSQLGYHVIKSCAGQDALKIWKEHRQKIDLLLTDMVMPDGMTGKDLAEKLLAENPKLKVIYTSGYSVEIAGRDFPLQEGVNFITKPFGTQKLARTVRNRLDLNESPTMTV
jgi:CheY-like chemotaxis protein